MHKIYNEGEWSEEFMEMMLLPVQKKNNAKKYREFRTQPDLTHFKHSPRILNRRLHSKMEEEQFGFRKGKGTRDPIGLIRTI